MNCRPFTQECVRQISTLCVTLLLFVHLFPPAPAESAGRFLFRVSQGGDGVRPPGVWGGLAPPTATGSAPDLFSAGLALGNKSDPSSNLSAEVLTYDTARRRLYVSVRRRGPRSRLSDLYSAPLCTDTAAGVFLPVFRNVRLVDTHHVHLTDEACGWKCGWGPFAVFEGRIYFILSVVLHDDPSRLMRQTQVRVIAGCEEQLDAAANRPDLDTPYDLDILECSELISVLHTEDYKLRRPRPRMWAAGNMVAFRLQDGVSVVFQMFDIREDPPVLKLVQVSVDTRTNRVLNSIAVDRLYAAGNFRVKALGGVDYRDTILCWTAVDQLLCSYYDHQHAVEPTHLLRSGDATDAGICAGAIPQTRLLNILTGVAIAETEKLLSVFVGCYSDISGVGGVGVITSKHGLSTRRLPVMSGSTRVFGGSLVLTPQVKCHTTRSPTTTPPTTPTTTPTTTTIQKTTTSAPRLMKFNLTLPVHRDQHKPVYALAPRAVMSCHVTVGLSVIVALVWSCRRRTMTRSPSLTAAFCQDVPTALTPCRRSADKQLVKHIAHSRRDDRD
ncbi:hypothetical protein LSAT2_029986 [Lamellibrachia satsuma]|nr:hypothetical protein LSAT2_029986 [Lamellibrachia satsuma]